MTSDGGSQEQQDNNMTDEEICQVLRELEQKQKQQHQLDQEIKLGNEQDAVDEEGAREDLEDWIREAEYTRWSEGERAMAPMYARWRREREFGWEPSDGEDSVIQDEEEEDNDQWYPEFSPQYIEQGAREAEERERLEKERERLELEEREEERDREDIRVKIERGEERS